MPKIDFKTVLVSAVTMLLIFSLTFGLFFLAIKSQYKAFVEADEEVMASHGHQIVQYMEERLLEATAPMDVLVFCASQNPDNINTFSIAANQVLSKHPIISAVGIAPKGVISKIYPLESNEGIEGFDLLNSPQHGEKIRQSQHSMKPVMLGPMELAPGNWGMKIYQPVANDRGDFWGFITLTVKLSEAFKYMEIESSLGPNIMFRLGRFNVERGEIQYFSSNIKTSNFAVNKVFTLDWQGIWRVELIQKQDRPKDLVAYAIAMVISLIVAILGLIILLKKRKADILKAYDAAFACPDRFKTILLIDKTLDSVSSRGLSMVLIISTESIKEDLHAMNNFRSLIARSMRSKDLIFDIDGSHLMVVLVGLSSRQLAEDITRKLFNKIIDQREHIGLAGFLIKIGACVNTPKVSRVSAVGAALESLTISFQLEGDVLEIS